MKPQPAKFIGFFKLMEAMKTAGCPVCLRILEDTHHDMDRFLYESVNDPGIRDEIRNDWGLCHRHSWQLARFGDALGEAILFHDVLKSVLERISGRAVSFNHKAVPANLGRQVCYFCRLEHRSREGTIGTIVAHAEDAELNAGWEGPAMMCFAHLTELCGRLRDAAARDQLIEIHRRKYAVLCEEMSELIEKQSYKHHPSEIGAEKDSWTRAIEVLVGRLGVR